MIAPDVLVTETANAIWKRCALSRGISADEALRALVDLQRILPELVPSAALVEQALALALRFRHAVYDCLYVALALRDGSTLVTYDAALVRSMGPATGRVMHVDAISLAN